MFNVWTIALFCSFNCWRKRISSDGREVLEDELVGGLASWRSGFALGGAWLASLLVLAAFGSCNEGCNCSFYY